MSTFSFSDSTGRAPAAYAAMSRNVTALLAESDAETGDWPSRSSGGGGEGEVLAEREPERDWDWGWEKREERRKEESVGRQVEAALWALMERRGSLARDAGAGEEDFEEPEPEPEEVEVEGWRMEGLGPRRELRGGRGGVFSVIDSPATDLLFVFVPKSAPVNVEFIVVARWRVPWPNVLMAFSALKVGMVGDSEREDAGVAAWAWTGFLGGTGKAWWLATSPPEYP